MKTPLSTKKPVRRAVKMANGSSIAVPVKKMPRYPVSDMDMVHATNLVPKSLLRAPKRPLLKTFRTFEVEDNAPALSLVERMNQIRAQWKTVETSSEPWIIPAFDDDDSQSTDPFIKPIKIVPGNLVLPAPAPFVPVEPPTYVETEINHVEHLLLDQFPVKPTFQMGIEFEGLVRKDVYAQFVKSMTDLGYDEESGLNLISFGYDDSIKDYSPLYEPVEIRTETVRSKTGIRLLEDMLSFLYIASQTGDWLTNASCGLHINISEPTVWEKGLGVDFYAHVLRHFDESAILSRFGRLTTAHGRKYCKVFFGPESSHEIEDIKHQYHLCKRRERAAKERGSEINQQVKESKYFAVALRDSPAHDDWAGEQEVASRIEFRCIGNESYHLKLDDLEESVNHIISVLRLAYREVMT